MSISEIISEIKSREFTEKDWSIYLRDVPSEFIDIVDGEQIVTDNLWYVDDGFCEVGFDCTSRMEAADEYVSGGTYGECDRPWDGLKSATTWVSVVTYRKGFNRLGEGLRYHAEDLKVTVEPESLDCLDSEHQWVDYEGAQGHQGGVIYSEVCIRCAGIRRTDTWATDSSDGEQGLTEVRYLYPTDRSKEYARTKLLTEVEDILDDLPWVVKYVRRDDEITAEIDSATDFAEVSSNLHRFTEYSALCYTADEESRELTIRVTFDA